MEDSVEVGASGVKEPHLRGADVAVLYEEEALLAVNKPAGLVVHPAYKHPDGTLADEVFARAAARGEGRPWLLHRLDRETSGVVLFAKTEAARRAVVGQLERHTMHKRYLAVVSGALPTTEGEIEAPLARDPADRRRVLVTLEGKPAKTRYRVLATTGDSAFVLAEPVTGRTHQIRAHFASIGAPLAGDVLYLPPGTPPLAPRTLLHAWRLGLRYPGTGAPLEIVAPLPADLIEALSRLELSSGLARLACLDEISGVEERSHPAPR
jgi:23S rRNA pseudouridine1911/1915/1917 synthase